MMQSCLSAGTDVWSGKRLSSVKSFAEKKDRFLLWVIGNPNIARAHIAVNRHYPIEW